MALVENATISVFCPMILFKILQNEQFWETVFPSVGQATKARYT